MRIESLTLRGMGRAEDGTEVPRVLPGEEVEVAPDGAVRVLTPSPSRVAPPCRHAKACGGCVLQHASDAFVAEWKRQVVSRALQARGLEAQMIGPLTSPQGSRRRAKFAGRRTRSGALVGFHRLRSDQIVAVPDCRVLAPEIVAALPALEELARLAASRRSEVPLTVTASLGGLDVHCDTPAPLTGPLRAELAMLADRADWARLSWADETVVTRRPPEQPFGRARVVPPPGGFLQATPQGEAALVAAVRAAVGEARRVLDLFAGAGTFALPLAECAEVHAVEGDAAALASLDAGWRKASGLKRVTTEVRDLSRRPLDPAEMAGAEAAVIDPPRAGAEAQVRVLAEAGPPRLAMVSCNPVTFARDVAVLVAAGYALGPVTVVDQFRWSPHVEVIAPLTRL